MHISDWLSGLQTLPITVSESAPAQDLEQQSHEPKQTNSQVLFRYTYRITCLWFLASATACCVFSLPISLIGLPFVFILGVWAALTVIVLTWIYRLINGFITALLAFLKKCLMAPVNICIKLWTKLADSVFGEHDKIEFPPLKTSRRRQSVAPMYPERRKSFFDDGDEIGLSTDTPWSYYDSTYKREENVNLLRSSSSIDRLMQHALLQDSHEAITNDRSPTQTQFKIPVKESTTSLLANVSFKTLRTTEIARISVCKELYANITNTSSGECSLVIGANKNATHSVVSVWNDEKIQLESLIGFVEYFSTVNTSCISIDKLIMSSLYSQHGFSKRIIRKLQHITNITSISVWSLWHAESFYKTLGFKDVMIPDRSATFPGKPARVKKERVEGESGPLLVWNREEIPGILGNRTVREVRSKDSLVSLVGGSGAYNTDK